jgi:hypothetical protein
MCEFTKYRRRVLEENLAMNCKPRVILPVSIERAYSELS